MNEAETFWVAAMETRHTRSQAYGATPAKALEALVDAWIFKHCHRSEAEPGYPWELKEDIEINQAEMGQGYILAGHDDNWFPVAMNAADPALGSTWDALAVRHGITFDPAPR